MKKLILIITLALVSTGASAQGGYLVKGTGGLSCGDYVADRRANGSAWQAQADWMMGFLSGANLVLTSQGLEGNLGSGLSFDSIGLWIEKHCLENPLDPVSEAGRMLFIKLIGDKLN